MTYDFICTGCDMRWEHDTATPYSPNAKHSRNGKKCGNIRRNWKSINMNTANLRKARD